MLFFLPRHVCRKLGVRVDTYLREAYALPVLVSLPLVLTLLLMKHWFVPHNYLQLAIHLLAAGIVYGSTLLWVFASQRAMKVGHLGERAAERASPRELLA